jgi:alpha-galactosidase
MPFVDLTAMPHFSFRYAGESSHEFLASWQQTIAREGSAEGHRAHVTYFDPGSGLKVTAHALAFAGFPATDWWLEFENCGATETPVIEDILPLDTAVVLAPHERLWLHHAKGSSCRIDDFLPLTDELVPTDQILLKPQGGRSSDGTLPCINLQAPGGGLVLAVGWSGQWMARLERDAAQARLSAGMARTRLRLQPGERIRTPRILLLAWEGDDANYGNNLLRQLLLAHYLPRIGGELVLPPVAQCLQGYYYLTGQASEAFEMTALPKAAAVGCEAYWIDACWYGAGGNWWEEVGSWEVNRERFPRGLKPISDAAHEQGMKFVLWFEPERVRAGSQLQREHPEFLLASPVDRSNLLLNLGLPEARGYITDLISQRIAEHGVDIYRQDFNFDPLPYWQAADAPDRIGMTEIRYVEGLYALWDELRRRHPGVSIDNCASGGRRIDLETLSRSLPLWPSDFPDIIGLPFGQRLHAGDQCINAGLARWVPLFGGGVWEFTPYGTRGQLIGGFNFGFDISPERFPADEATDIVTPNDVLALGKTLLDEDFPLGSAHDAIAEWRNVRSFFLGDFHLLLPLTVASHDWCAWQFHRADLEAGVAMFFRRHRSPFPKIEASLHGIASDAMYDVSLSAGYQEAPRRRMRGEELLRLQVAIPEMPGSVLLRYSRVR